MAAYPFHNTLTPAQRECLRLAAQGLSNAQIARARGVRLPTVKCTLTAAYLRLDVHTRTAAVIRAMRLGLIAPELPPAETVRHEPLPAQRGALAWARRRDGWTWPRIARHLGYPSPHDAYRAAGRHARQAASAPAVDAAAQSA